MVPPASGERVVEAVVENDDEEKDTLGDVLAESVIGLSKHELQSGRGSRKKRNHTRNEKPERVQEPRMKEEKEWKSL